MTLPNGWTVWDREAQPSTERGSWTCNACGFHGFWRGLHCGPGQPAEATPARWQNHCGTCGNDWRDCICTADDLA